MFYRWPQGRIVRTSMLVICALVAADLLWRGAYAQLSAYSDGTVTSVSILLQGLFMGLLGVAFIVGGIVTVGFLPKTAQFLIEVEQEVAKVIWPTRAELTRFTVMIAVMSVILAILVFGVDGLNRWLLFDVIGVGGRGG